MFCRSDSLAEAIGGRLVAHATREVERAGLSATDFSLTLLLHGPDAALPPGGYAYRGDALFYPCSVVKSFLVVAAQRALVEGWLRAHEQLERAMLDMIRWSSNTATNYVIDLLSGTTGDTLLDDADMARWVAARNRVNQLFQGLQPGVFGQSNLSQKLMDDDRYGREKVFVQWNGANNHNRLSSNAAAWIISQIMGGGLLPPEAAQSVRAYHHRPLEGAFRTQPGAQVRGYLGEVLPPGARLWSKAGRTEWTRDPLASYRRHDVAHVALADGKRYTLAVFTQGQAISMADGFLPGIGALAADCVAASRA